MFALIALAASASTILPPPFPEALGLECSAVYQAERLAGSTARTLEPDTTNDRIAYSAQMEGRSVIRGYTCARGKIVSHVVMANISNEDEAKLFFLKQVEAVESSLGKSCAVFEALPLADRDRLRKEMPDLMKELQNTFEWSLSNGMHARASLYNQSGTKYWVAAFSADGKGALCP